MADRSTGAKLGETITLRAQFFTGTGIPMDTDSTPFVKISLPSGAVLRNSSPIGVTTIGTGLYQVNFQIPTNITAGPGIDMWVGNVMGVPAVGAFNFLMLPATGEIVDGTPTLGDDPIFDFSSDEICGLNSLMKILNKKLRNKGKNRQPDGYGGFIEQPCDIFSVEELVCFLQNSLDYVNSVPHFTDLSFDCFCNGNSTGRHFSYYIIEYAYLTALMSLVPEEQGRMFQFTDDSVTWSPPDVAGALERIHGTRYQILVDNIKFFKLQFKPAPIAISGSYSLSNFRNPAFTRLRHLRSRQII